MLMPSLVATWLVLASAPATLLRAPDIHVEDRVETYRIEGRTATELAAQMQALGPVGSVTGKRAAGYTDTQVSWRHVREMDDGACRLLELEVGVAIVTTLPEWVRPRNGRSGLAVQWKRFMASLRAHEATHRQHGLQSAGAVRQAILALPPQADCQRLEQAIDRAARREIRRHAAISRRYDALTDFGAREGVRLEVRGPPQATR